MRGPLPINSDLCTCALKVMLKLKPQSRLTRLFIVDQPHQSGRIVRRCGHAPEKPGAQPLGPGKRIGGGRTLGRICHVRPVCAICVFSCTWQVCCMRVFNCMNRFEQTTGQHDRRQPLRPHFVLTAVPAASGGQRCQVRQSVGEKHCSP